MSHIAGRPRTPTRRATRLAWLAAGALLVVLAVPRPALAVSIGDLVQLSRAGLSDDVLVALIETDGTIFSLDASRLIELKRAGLSDRVLMAMLKNGRETAPAGRTEAPAEAPPPVTSPPPGTSPPGMPSAATEGLLVIGGDQRPEPQPPAFVIVAPFPVLVPFVVPHGGGSRAAGPLLGSHQGFGRFINDGFDRFINDGFNRFLNDGFVSGPPVAPATPGRSAVEGRSGSAAGHRRPGR
jgi:hypothetical protein